jgi:hypothetical protein
VQQEACRARWGSGNDAFKQCMRTAGCSAWLGEGIIH